MPDQKSITILHLSDPQFGRNHRFGNLAAGDPDAQFDTLLQRLKDDLDVLINQEGVKPQIVVVSGDLAEWALEPEYEDALAFLAGLSDHLAIPRRRFVIVPGNHDINRDEAEAYFIQCRPRRTQPQEPYLPKWKYYIEFFERFYQGEKEISFSPVDPWTLWEFEDLRLVVAGMNSTMKESHEEDSHYGWVGERQLRWFSDRLRKSKERGWFRLGVVHHNIERGAVTDDENLRDADDLKNILGPNLNLLLHGHTHSSKISWLKPSIPVLSTGSAALKTEARPPEVPNQYQVIRIRPDRIERWTRQYDVGGKRWIGDTRCSEKGDRWHVKDVVHFEDVYGALEPSWKEPEIHGRRESEALDRREDFATRVCEVARLKYRDSEVDIRRSDASRLDYLHVRVMDGTVARIQPIGVSEHGISGEQIEAFGQEVVAQYRSLDPTLPCAIVYGGDLAAQELVHKASGMGIGLVSFVEFQGIVDFRGYVQRQTEKIISDIVYPYGLYVPQRMLYEIGRDQHESGDACATILEWLKEPFGRFALVLGDFGTGKTFLMHELARRIPVEIPHLTPVLIELRNLEKAGTFGQLIAQHLAYSGETRIDLEAFPYMLKEGRIVLLFDGFDELVLRVTYQRATEHLDTLLQSAQGRARVVVSSRTQHFESDAQVRTALYQRAEVLPSLRVARLQLFDDAQILKFLENLLKGDREQAARRFALIHDIRDLLGLSQNPRMLSFIAALPEEQLRDAQESKGKITSAELYRMLIERWLTFEEKRLSPSGAVPTLNVQERWDAVATVALCLWPRLDRTLRLTELTEEAAHIVEKLTQAQKAQLDTHTLTHLVGSGTLLVRDESGAFAFVHQSVMEWLVADHAAKQMVSGSVPSMLMSREMSDLMTDFFCDLAGEKAALQWTVNTLTDYTISEPAAKSNAVRVRTRLGYEIPLSASLVATDLRGRSLSGQNFSGANLQNADLTDARLDGADLSNSDLTNAVLERAILTRAKLTGANLQGVNAEAAGLLGADLRGANLAGANLRRARLVGAQVSAGTLERCDLFGAALPQGNPPQPTNSAASSVESIAFGPSSLMASGHLGGVIRLWDLQSGQPIRMLKGHENSVTSVVFSPDGRRLASGSEDNTVKVWDAGSGLEERTLRGHENSVMSVAFSPDGRRLASGSQDNTVKVWDMGSGLEERTLRGHENSVTSVAFSPDGRRLASGSWDNTVKVWDTGSGLEERTLRGHENSVTSVAFSPDGRWLASGGWDDTVKVWDAGSGLEKRTLRGHENSVMSVVFSPDGRRLASGSGDNTVKVWDMGSGLEERTLKEHQNGVTSVAFSSDGRWLASGSWDNTVKVWDAGSGSEERTLKGHENWVVSVAFSPDGRRLASGSGDSTVKVWDAGSGQEERTLKGHESSVVSVAFSPDGRRLASGSGDSTVKVWDAESGQEERTLKGHERSVMNVAFSPDGRRLASCSKDDAVKVWDAESGLEERTLKGHKNSVTSVAFSPDGRRLASGSWDDTVKVWNAESGLEERTLKGHGSSVTSVAFSPDGRRLASGSWDSTVKVWDAGSGSEERTLKGHGGWVMSVAFSPDGRRLASGGIDNTLRLWDVTTGELLATIVPAAEGWAVFTPDGLYKVSGNMGGAFWYVINLCRFEPGELDEFLPPGTLRRLEADEKLY